MKRIPLLLFAAAFNLHAASFTPTTTSDFPVSGSGISVNTANGVISGGAGNGQITLRSAVIAANANSGSTINLLAAAYTLTLAGDDGNGDPNPAIGDLDVLASITIKGAGPGNTIVQAGTNPSNGIDQIFTFNAYYWSTGQSAVVNGFSGTARDLTFRYGRVVNRNTQSGSFVGGAISFDAGYDNGNPIATPGSLYISNCVFDSCSGPYGAGAIQTFDGGTVTIDHCIFTNCVGFSDAGEGAPGGAICVGSTANSGSATIQNSTFLNNSAAGDAGAILYFGNTPLAIHNCVFSNNVATDQAGAIAADTGTLTVDQNSLFVHNISGNPSGVAQGGAIWIQAGSAVISNATFLGNIAATNAGLQWGGGAIAVSSSATLLDCRFFGNVATNGTGVWKDSTAGTVTAINNWWGNNNGPGSAGADSVVAVSPGVATSNPWLTLTLAAAPNAVLINATASLTASVTKNSSSTSGFSLPAGTPVTFGGMLGAASPASTALTSGTATSIFTAGSVGGAGQASVALDNQTVTAAITVNQPPSFTSANHAVFLAGLTNGFFATATGFPAPAFTASGVLPAWASFNAAGVLSGTPPNGSGGNYSLTLLATNGVSLNATQSFNLSVVERSTFAQRPSFETNGFGWALNGDTINGGPSLVNNLLTLTDGSAGENRSAWFRYPLYVGGFQASFTYQDVSTGGADGTAFVIQNDARGTTALGGGGGGLAYLDILDSVALMLDIYSGAPGGPSGVLVATNGMGDGAGYSSSIYQSTAPVNLDGGNPIAINLRYTGNHLQISMTDTMTSASFKTNVSINIPAFVGTNTAWVGLTGSEGGVLSHQTVSNFSYVPLPTLTVAPAATGSLLFSWPATIYGFTLESNTNLTHATSWTPVSATIGQTNGLNQTVIPVSSSSQFFRLVL